MNWRAQCGVVIPCLNEAGEIGPLVEAVRRRFDTVLVVDDGSSDATGHLAAAAGAIVLRHERSLGKGAALATGLNWLHRKGLVWGLLMDGDGQHAPDDIPAFLKHQETTQASMVVGDRMSDAAQMPWLRRKVNRWMSARLSALSGRFLPDSQCGFRLLHLPIWAELRLKTTHFEVESELLISFLKLAARVEFVPIHVIYGAERTKISPLLDTWRWFRWWHQAGSGWQTGERRGQGGKGPASRANSQKLLQFRDASPKLSFMTTPLALVFYESLMPGSQLVNRLQDLGYKVVTHTQAATLVTQAKESKPFLMVIDLASHSSDLCAIIRELRQNPETEHIPVLAFTRDSQEELRVAARSAGATLVAGDIAVVTHLPQLLDQVLEVGP